MAGKKTFKVTLERSLIGCTERQRETARCLGLRGRNSSKIVNDSAAARGQIRRIQHLVSVEVVS